MKWIFSLILLMTIEHCFARDIIVLSGDYLDKAQMIEKVIVNKIGIPEQFILQEMDNKKCHLRNQAVIQMCFKGLNYKVIHKKGEVLKNTISRILNTKGPQI